jgi:alpha/beta superfamily hydrolase
MHRPNLYRRVLAAGLLALCAMLPFAATATLAATAASELSGRVVNFTSKDGIALSGLWYGESDHVVVMSHQYNHDQQSWKPLAARLVAAGYAVLTYNFRGYPPSAGTRDIGQIGHDLDAAVRFARDQGAREVVLIGASMGGIATVPAAIVDHVTAYVTISAPLGFAGLVASDGALKGSAVPKLFINGERDDYIADTRHMAEVARPPMTLAVYPTGFHGTDLLLTKDGPTLQQQIVDFVKTSSPL